MPSSLDLPDDKFFQEWVSDLVNTNAEAHEDFSHQSGLKPELTEEQVDNDPWNGYICTEPEEHKAVDRLWTLLPEVAFYDPDELTVLKALVTLEARNLNQNYREGFVPEDTEELGNMSTARYERALVSLKGRFNV